MNASESLWYVESYDRINKIWHRYSGKYTYKEATDISKKLAAAGWKVRLARA